jgi:hypothetical protein
MVTVTVVAPADEIYVEDSGQVKWTEIADGSEVFFRVHSWDEDGKHPAFDALIEPGAVYRVTIVKEEG